MNKPQCRRSRQAVPWLLSLACMAGPSLAGTGKPVDEVQQRYEQERAACESGRSSQDRPACLREAGAARAQARADGQRGTRKREDAAYAGNQVRRCDPLPAADRADCIARMKGQGTTSGAVADGGIYRELVTVEPAASAPAQ